MAIKASIFFVIFTALAPWLYDRYLGISTILANRPGKFRSVNLLKQHEVKFRDVVRNCEDVIIEEEIGVAFLSCDPGRDRWNTVMGSFHPPYGSVDRDSGRIWMYNYSAPELADNEALRPLALGDFEHDLDLHPLGLDFDAARSTLYVINHSRRAGSVIDIFEVDVGNGSADHVRRFTHPLLHALNALQLLGNGTMYVTNDHYFRAAVSPLLSKVESFSGMPGGTVVYADLHNPQDTKVVARVSFANGLALLNATTLAVASSGALGVFLYTIEEDHSLTRKKYIRTSAAVDNLSVDSSGKLLLAGHPFAPSLMKVAMGRAECEPQGSAAQKAKCECNAPSWVAEWSEDGGLRELFTDNGEIFCSSSTAVKDVGRHVGFVSGLYEQGVLVFRE